MLKRLLVPVFVFTAAAPALAHPGHAHDESMSTLQVVLHAIMGVNPLVTVGASVALAAGVAFLALSRKRSS